MRLNDKGSNRNFSKNAPSRLDLTEREQEVLQCLVRGLSYKQCAEHLGISLDTVRTHIRAVYKKLQVHSVAEAVARAIREKLV
jgi:DNA-binding NarL/FixJ family response regulator